MPLWSPFPVCICKHLIWLLECLCFPRTLRQVKDRSQDKLLQDEEVLRSLVCLFTQLLKHDLKNQRDLPQSTHSIDANVPDERSAVMLNTLGFSVERKRSSLQFAGNGVFVTQGRAPKGTIVAMYPGILYNVTCHCNNSVHLEYINNTLHTLLNPSSWVLSHLQEMAKNTSLPSRPGLRKPTYCNPT